MRAVLMECLRVRNIVLLLLVLQTTSIVLLMRYSRTRAGVVPYLPSVAVMMAELLKLPVCIIMTLRSAGDFGTFVTLLREEVLGRPLDTVKCAVPALAYTVQGNLLFFALAALEAPTYQVAYQSKTLFTALFSSALLSRKLKASQWLAVVLLSVGTVLVSDLSSSGRKRDATGISSTLGFLAVLAAALLSASSSVYFEKMLKTPPSSDVAQAASLWLRNIQLGFFAAPLAAFGVFAGDRSTVAQSGLLAGFDGVVWTVVVLNGVGGLLVAATMKYADNIAKCFAAALAILTGTLLSVPLFSFRLSPLFSAGALLTIVASVLYAWAPVLSRPSKVETETQQHIEATQRLIEKA